MGLPVTARAERAAPPRASPSVLVRTRPVSSICSWKVRATLRASWPVMASRTRRTSWGWIRSRVRRSSSIISLSIWSRPAVSTKTTSAPAWAAASTPWAATSTGSPCPSWQGTPTCLASTRSWSTAAGRYRSPATRWGRRPCCLRRKASLAAVVVFPEPWRPQRRITVGGREANWIPACSPPIRAVSSSRTIRITCWAGVRLFKTSSPTARARIRSRRSFTTRKLTSASRRARRTSLRASSTSAGESLPRPERRRKASCNRSVSRSKAMTPLLWAPGPPAAPDPAGARRPASGPPPGHRRDRQGAPPPAGPSR